MEDPPSDDLVRFRALFNKTHPDDQAMLERIETAVRVGSAYIEFSPSGDSFVVLQPVRDLHVWSVGGDMDEIIAMEADISMRAKNAYYDRMTALPSREGWDRALRERGWKQEAVTPIVKELW